MSTEPHVVRDLGDKLADDFHQAAMRTLSLVLGDFDACYKILDLAIGAPIAGLLAFRIAQGQSTEDATIATIAEIAVCIRTVTSSPRFAASIAMHEALTRRRAPRS